MGHFSFLFLVLSYCCSRESVMILNNPKITKGSVNWFELREIQNNYKFVTESQFVEKVVCRTYTTFSVLPSLDVIANKWIFCSQLKVRNLSNHTWTLESSLMPYKFKCSIMRRYLSIIDSSQVVTFMFLLFFL